MRMKPWLSAAVAALALLVGGCAGGAYAPKNTDTYDLENRANFVLLDKEVQRSVTHAGINERVLPDERLEVTASVRNRLNRRITVQINCVFRDFTGAPIGDETPFETLILTENAMQTVKFTSMTTKARMYTIRVRQVR